MSDQNKAPKAKRKYMLPATFSPDKVWLVIRNRGKHKLVYPVKLDNLVRFSEKEEEVIRVSVSRARAMKWIRAYKYNQEQQEGKTTK